MNNESVILQVREIGESDWKECDEAEYQYASKSPQLDTRKLYTSPFIAIPEGMAIVPVELTERMIDAGVDAALIVADEWMAGNENKNPHIARYKAMIAAAQKGGVK